MAKKFIPISTNTLSVEQLNAAENISNGRISQAFNMEGVRVIVMEGQEDKPYRWNGNVWEAFTVLALASTDSMA